VSNQQQRTEEEDAGCILLSQAQIVELVESRIDLFLEKLHGKEADASQLELESGAKLEPKNCLSIASKEEAKERLSKSVQTLLALRVMRHL
jgi:hypothetical protein